MVQIICFAIWFLSFSRVGDKVPFAKKGRFGVVSGSIEQHFSPYHLLIETGSIDDLAENILIQRVRADMVLFSGCILILQLYVS